MAVFVLKAFLVIWMIETSLGFLIGLSGKTVTERSFEKPTSYGWAVVIGNAVLDLCALASAMFLAYHNL